MYAYTGEIDAWWAGREAQLGAGTPQPEVAPGTSSPRHRLGLFVLGLLLTALALVWSARLLEDAVVSPPGRAMLAVLPFDNLSGDPDQEYFSDGLTEELLTELGRLDPDRLGVIARTSVMQYKHDRKSVREIGRELSVDYLLEGSVRRADDRVRINAQLIRVDDQTHLWAEAYDRPLHGILTLQSEVARSVAGAIGLKLTARPGTPRGGARSAVPEAYDALLRGRHFWGQRTPAALLKAQEYMQQAVEADPNFALAWADLAGIFSMMSYYGVLPLREAYRQAQEAAQRALELDSDLAPAHAVLGTVRERWQWDWAGADAAFRRAMELDPNYATGHHWYGLFLERMDRLDEAKAAMHQALELDPVSLIINKNAADPDLYAGDYDRAIEQYRRALELDPDFGPALLFLGLAFEQQNRLPEAFAAFERAKAVDRHTALAALGHAYARTGDSDRARQILAELGRSDAYVDPFHVAVIHVGLDEPDPAFAWLEQAYATHSEWLLNIKIDPRLQPLHGDRRYRDLLARMNLSPGTE